MYRKFFVALNTVLACQSMTCRISNFLDVASNFKTDLFLTASVATDSSPFQMAPEQH